VTRQLLLVLLAGFFVFPCSKHEMNDESLSSSSSFLLILGIRTPVCCEHCVQVLGSVVGVKLSCERVVCSWFLCSLSGVCRFLYRDLLHKTVCVREVTYVLPKSKMPLQMSASQERSTNCLFCTSLSL
jgi:hypothetical protein